MLTWHASAARRCFTLPDGASGPRLRLAGRRLGLRRQRRRAAAEREGPPRRGDRVRPALRRRRAAALHLGPAPLLLRAAARDARDLPAVDVPRRGGRLRRGRGRRLARLREHALPRAAALLRATASGRSSPTGRPRWRRTSTEAERMLGVAEVEADDPADQLLREYGREIGADDTYAKTRVGVFFGEPGVTVPDPYFGGAGPDRAGCVACGRCMVGCPHNAKNTLRQELPLAGRARRRGDPPGARGRRRARRSARPTAPRATRSRRSGPARGCGGTGRRVRARGVVIAAGALGTNKLLRAASAPARCRASRTASAAACAPTRRRSSRSRSRRSTRT